ncbi:hypothetical protein LB506_004718 [Fusarium annulatum]|nr:hypothetical protein LB506_004718 [Fusarium annulatum]
MSDEETQSAPVDDQTQVTPADDQEPTLYHMGLPGPFLVVGQSLRLVGAIDEQGNFRSLALQTCYGLPSHQQKQDSAAMRGFGPWSTKWSWTMDEWTVLESVLMGPLPPFSTGPPFVDAIID